jgi:hypothetical protein
MSDDRDPPRLRLSGDSPSDLVQALELARQDLPRAADLMRFQAGIDATLATSSDGAGTSELQVTRRRRSMRPVAAGATTSFKLMLAAAVAASGLGAGLWMFATTPEAPEPHAMTAPNPTAARPSGQIVPFEAREAPAESAPGAALNEPKGSNVVVPETKPRAVPSNETTVRAPNNEGAPVGAATFGDPGATEVSLLGRAQQALATDPGGALALTVEHARAFPRGTLAQEREFIAIQALEALGRHPEAVARAARFRANYPSSAHLRRLDPLLGIPANAAP